MIALLIVFFLIGANQGYSGNWESLLFDTNGVFVSWQEKYGYRYEDTCIGLWQNKQQFLLTKKNHERIILQKGNVNYIKYHKIGNSKSSE